LEKINAAMEIEVSATPFFKSSYTVKIERREVVAAEMIKKTVYLNDSLQSELQDDKFNIYLLNEALKKREELKLAYEKEGIKINPLLLVQLPSDNQNETELDNKIKELITLHLTKVKSISFNNGKLAVWLSKEKQNLETITQLNDLVDVLIFKQGISLGWDCPRAAVLLIYREIKQFSFTVQTIGRIMRMPQQKHYITESLNYGYVYTNLNRNLITIIKDEMNFMPQNESIRKNEIYQNLNLDSSYSYTREFRPDRLKSKEFYTVFDEVLKNWYKQTLENNGSEPFYITNRNTLTTHRFYDFDFSVLNIQVIVSQEFRGDENEVIRGEDEHLKKFVRHADEIYEQLMKFIHQLCPPYNIKDSSGMVEKALIIHFFEKYLQIFEKDARIVILKNQQQITDLMNEVLRAYQVKIEKLKEGKTRDIQKINWEVPEKQSFGENYVSYEAQIPIMEPLYLKEREKGRLADSDTEFEFIKYLESEQMKPAIKWWYKNGTKGKEHFAIQYKNIKGKISLFYVDFVIFKNNETLLLFDTKTINSDSEMTAKHNALIEFAEKRTQEGKITIASIVLPKNNSWWYCQNRIEKFEEDLLGWDIFNG